jgi:isoleucyl-tRNA synthetase
MSKSLGNIIEPEKMVKQYGADLLRLWVASVDFTEDVRLSDTILARLSEAYRKLRNTFRYTLGNLYDFDPAIDPVRADELQEIDQWMLIKAEELVRRCRSAYDELSFHSVYRAVYDFAVMDLSAVYFDILKDRLYTTAPRSHARRSAQTAIYRLHLALARLMAPILSYTCEEVWGHTRLRPGSPASVHLAYLPVTDDLTSGLPETRRGRLANWDKLMGIRDQVMKSLDQTREEKVIGGSLEAAVLLTAGGELHSLLAEYQSQLPALFIVSQVEVRKADTEELSIAVTRAVGDKCERCWKYTLDVGSDPDFPTICEACAAAVKESLEP